MRRNNLSVAVIGLILSVAIAFGGMSAVAKPPTFEQPTETLTDESWTVMVYLCGDNNLEPYALMDLDEMELVGSQNDVTVIVYMDLTDALITGTHWYVVEDASKGMMDHINADTGDFTCDCEEVTGIACEDGSGDEADMGDGATLTEFIVQCVDYAPADRYMLILWDHGGGWRGVCYDDSHWVVDEELGWVSRLTVPETADAIAAAEAEIAAKELDDDYRLTILGYDACLMGMVEVVYENRHLADYMFASITLVSVLGQDYTRILENVTHTPRMTPEQIGIAIVDSFANFYEDYVPTGQGIEGWGDQSMSLFRLDTEDNHPVQDLVDSVNGLAHELFDEGYLTDFSYRGPLESAESQTPKIPSNKGEQLPFVDLGLYAEKLGEKIPDEGILEWTDQIETNVGRVVVHENHVTSEGGAIMRTTGITVYFTCCYNYINPAYQYDTLDEAVDDGNNVVYFGLEFVVYTWWDEFVFTYTQALDETLYSPY